MGSDMKDFASMIDSFVEWISERGRVMVYSFLAGVILMLVFGCSAANAYTKPQGAPEVVIPSRGVTVAIWAEMTAIGHGIGIFERVGTGAWTLCGQCFLAEYPTMDGPVAAAGGPGPYVESKRAEINAILAARFPPVGGEPSGSTIDKVNASLGTNVLRLVNGSPQLGPR